MGRMKCKRREGRRKKSVLWSAWVVVTKDNAELVFGGFGLKAKAVRWPVLTKK